MLRAGFKRKLRCFTSFFEWIHTINRKRKCTNNSMGHPENDGVVENRDLELDVIASIFLRGQHLVMILGCLRVFSSEWWNFCGGEADSPWGGFLSADSLYLIRPPLAWVFADVIVWSRDSLENAEGCRQRLWDWWRHNKDTRSRWWHHDKGCSYWRVNVETEH